MDKDQVQATEQEQAKQTEQANQQAETNNQTISKDQLDSIIGTLKSDFEKRFEIQKKEIEGLNRTISKKDDIIKSHMTEEERIKLEKEEAQKELDRVREDAARIKREQIISSTLLETKLTKDFAKLITGNTEEEIKTSVNILQEHINKEVENRVRAEKNQIFGNPKPVQGDSAPTDTRTQAELLAKQGKGNEADLMVIKDVMKQQRTDKES